MSADSDQEAPSVVTIAEVAVENTAAPFDKLYSYTVPPDAEPILLPGCRVSVPFGRGNRRRTGLVLEVSRRGEAPGGLKELSEILDPVPLLEEEGLFLLRYLKSHTFCGWFDALRALIPAGLGVRGKMMVSLGKPDGQPLTPRQEHILDAVRRTKGSISQSLLLTKTGSSPDDPELVQLLDRGVLEQTELLRQRVQDAKQAMVRLSGDPAGHRLTPKQQAVVSFLMEAESASIKELCYYTGVTRSVADNLEEKGLVEYYQRPMLRSPAAFSGPAEVPARLSAEQQAARDQLYRVLRQSPCGGALLHGVTGSGKTQVFLSLIDEVLSQGKSAMVLVPEISLTSQAVETFYRRFGSRVALLHSGLSLGERMDEWKRIRGGGADIVVGTRSAVFAPLKNIGLIVIDEEQEHTYKSEQSPRYHTRDVARVRCGCHGAMLLLSSATPSVESYHAARTGKLCLVELRERYNHIPLPAVEVLDMREEPLCPGAPSVSLALAQALREGRERGEQSILLLNRRGYSTLVRCSSCGTVVECPHCSVSLTYHAANGSLMCHYCGWSQPPASRCGLCGSGLVRYGGSGTQKLEEELGRLLPNARILRVDMDTTMRKFSHEKLFHSFASGEYDIMVGTQMVAKGLNFPSVTLVGVICADQSLYNGDFRSYERTFSLLTQVVGRSGRSAGGGRALIQTYTPENPIIQLAARQDYPKFFGEEIGSRRLHLYPPYCTMAGLGFVGEELEEVRQGADRFLEEFRRRATAGFRGVPVRLLGPIPFDQMKASGKFRYKLILKCKNTARTRELLEEMRQWFAAENRKVSLFVDMYYDRM